MKPAPLPPEPTEEEIQRAAYFLWEQEGRPAGRDQEIWLAARECLRRSVAVHPPRTRRTNVAATRARNAQPSVSKCR